MDTSSLCHNVLEMNIIGLQNKTDKSDMIDGPIGWSNLTLLHLHIQFELHKNRYDYFSYYSSPVWIAWSLGGTMSHKVWHISSDVTSRELFPRRSITREVWMRALSNWPEYNCCQMFEWLNGFIHHNQMQTICIFQATVIPKYVVETKSDSFLIQIEWLRW